MRLAFSVALVLPLVFGGTQARADGFCGDLAALAATLGADTSAPDQGFALPDQTGAVAGCRTSLNTRNVRSLHCMWRYAYRDEAARAAFDRLLQQVSACGSGEGNPDQGVNHPDYYDLRSFALDQGSVSVSLKDKGALGQTLVFLMVTDAP